jgi:hypothetical protein
MLQFDAKIPYRSVPSKSFLPDILLILLIARVDIYAWLRLNHIPQCPMSANEVLKAVE